LKYPNIEAERARRGISKAKLAKLLGVCEKTLYNWINSGVWPSTALQKMAEMFDCSIDYLLDQTGKRTNDQRSLYC